MGIIGGKLASVILKNFKVNSKKNLQSTDLNKVDHDKFKLLFGESFFQSIVGKYVIDFGCGYGRESVIMALNGAKKVVGLDIRDELLEYGNYLAKIYKVEQKCSFLTTTSEKCDVIISKDSFEHFKDPNLILKKMSLLLNPSGCVYASFGPIWYHPYGGHLFSVFPWAHLIFTESALIQWRSNFRNDGAKFFNDVAGGLNQMTIAKFLNIVKNSDFKFDYIDTIPIKGIKVLKNKFLREFGSSIVICKLILKNH